MRVFGGVQTWELSQGLYLFFAHEHYANPTRNRSAPYGHDYDPLSKNGAGNLDRQIHRTHDFPLHPCIL